MQALIPIRKEIDLIDEQLIECLARRQRCVEEAVRIKRHERLPARDPARVAEVISHARYLAMANNVEPALAEAIWTEMVEWFIAFEERSI